MEEAEGVAVPFPYSRVLDGDHGDDGKQLKIRPWFPVRKFRKRAGLLGELDGIWAMRGEAAAQEERRNPRQQLGSLGTFL